MPAITFFSPKFNSARFNLRPLFWWCSLNRTTKTILLIILSVYPALQFATVNRNKLPSQSGSGLSMTTNCFHKLRTGFFGQIF